MELVQSQTTTHYQLLELLGEGLTSRVYKAIRKHDDLSVEQLVALKVLKSNKLVQTLKTEINLLTRVKSEYCVSMLGWEKIPQGWSLILEHLEGVTLADLYATVGIEDHLVDEIVAQVQMGLKDLAKYGLHHGDLTPQNIFITISGGVKLLDFGFSDTRSQYGQPQFIAPEFWQKKMIDYRSDLFSLGLLMQDLKDKTLLISKTKEFWRERALNIKPINSLLHANPELRETLKANPSSKRKKELAQKSSLAMQIRQLQGKTIRINHQDKKYLCLWKLATRGVLFSLCLFFTKDISRFQILRAIGENRPLLSAQATDRVPPQHLKKKYRLTVRSAFWAKTALFLCAPECTQQIRAKAFTPVIWEGLFPARYQLRWEQGGVENKIFVQLQKNQLILLQ